MWLFGAAWLRRGLSECLGVPANEAWKPCCSLFVSPAETELGGASSLFFNKRPIRSMKVSD